MTEKTWHRYYCSKCNFNYETESEDLTTSPCIKCGDFSYVCPIAQETTNALAGKTVKGVYYDNMGAVGINRWMLFDDGTRARFFIEYSDSIGIVATDKVGNVLNPHEYYDEEEGNNEDE